ncbi:MAG: hypothetical protein R3Y13_04695 [bacterium]
MDYKKVNVLEYVKEGLEKEELMPVQATKYARIKARRGILGEKVITWSADQSGNAIIEKEASVQMNLKTKQRDWIVKKTDEEGNVLVDKNGKENIWIIDDETFMKKYELDNNNLSMYKPKGGIQTFVQIYEGINLEQWGSEMSISEGGYINITDLNDVYGISERDFNDTYKLLENEEKLSRKY